MKSRTVPNRMADTQFLKQMRKNYGISAEHDQANTYQLLIGIYLFLEIYMHMCT